MASEAPVSILVSGAESLEAEEGFVFFFSGAGAPNPCPADDFFFACSSDDAGRQHGVGGTKPKVATEENTRITTNKSKLFMIQQPKVSYLN